MLCYSGFGLAMAVLAATITRGSLTAALRRSASGQDRRMTDEARSARIVDTLVDAFSDLMGADPAAFRTKFRKMAADPFAFYRGSACLFYADVAERDDPWADERTSRVWIQGDLHAENFGTYMDGDGVLIFDVNDFDEAYIGHFTWDVTRFAASLALLGWRKAISDDDIRRWCSAYTRAYLDQVRWFVDQADDRSFSLRLGTTEGRSTRCCSWPSCAPGWPARRDHRDRGLRPGAARRPRPAPAGRRRARRGGRRVRPLPRVHPGVKRFRGVTYAVKDVAGRSGFGIGSAGLPAYRVLIEGYNQALDNDVVLSMKQGNVAARPG